MKKILYAFGFTLLAGLASLSASEPFNNIQGFYGERAAGLGGAFTALSDDPSGAYYNPAGMAFAHNDGFSLSASNFKNVKRSYINIDTPGQMYNQTHQGFDPNFVGILKTLINGSSGFPL